MRADPEARAGGSGFAAPSPDTAPAAAETSALASRPASPTPRQRRLLTLLSRLTRALFCPLLARPRCLPVRPSGRSPAAPEEASRPESPPAPPSLREVLGSVLTASASSVISANALRTYRVGPAHCHSQPLITTQNSRVPPEVLGCFRLHIGTNWFFPASQPLPASRILLSELSFVLPRF